MQKTLDELRNAQELAPVEEVEANDLFLSASDHEGDNEPYNILDIDAENAAAEPQRNGRYEQIIQQLRGDIENEKLHMNKELIAIIDNFLIGGNIWKSSMEVMLNTGRQYLQRIKYSIYTNGKRREY